MYLKIVSPGKAVMQHGEECIFWNLAAFDKKYFEAGYDMFSHLNQYWATLSQEDQQVIFNLYENIHNILDDTSMKEKRIKLLFDAVRDLYAIHSLAKLDKWVRYQSDIQWPNWLEVNYNPHSSEYHVSREQTYLLSDYKDLIVLALALRFILPIWSEYIDRAKDYTDTALKEYYAYQLLCKSELFRCPAMQKLTSYIACIIPADKPKSAIVSGLSSEEFPTWVLSVALIRKICISDIRGIFPDPTYNSNGKRIDPPTLVTYVFNHVRERVTHNANNFSGMIIDKDPEKQSDGGASNSEQQVSVLESNKVKQEVSLGDKQAIIHFISDYIRVATRMQPGIDPAFVHECVNIRRNNDLAFYQINDPQFTILQWLMAPYAFTRGMYLVPFEMTSDYLAVAEAVLWTRGKKYLAALMTATVYEGRNNIMQAAGTDTKARLSKELTDQVSEYYPYLKKSLSKSKIAPKKPTNQALTAVDIIADELSSKDWQINIHESRLKEITGTSKRRFSAPHDIKVLLTELVVDIAKAAEHNYNQNKLLQL